jgi:hypothetical protein
MGGWRRRDGLAPLIGESRKTGDSGMAKATRKKFGVTEQPLEGDRVLVKDLDADLFGGKVSAAIIVVNSEEGTFTAANVYGGELGRNYDPANYTHDLPEDTGAWEKTKAKKGYAEAEIDDSRLGGVVVGIGESVEVEA